MAVTLVFDDTDLLFLNIGIQELPEKPRTRLLGKINAQIQQQAAAAPAQSAAAMPAASDEAGAVTDPAEGA